MKIYRVFPDYSSIVTGVWNQIGEEPYIIDYPTLLEWGASPKTISILKEMCYVFDLVDENPSDAELDFISWCIEEATRRLNDETDYKFETIS